MSQLFYHLRNVNPQLLYQQHETQCFRKGLPQWRALGFGPIVDRVDGNGVLHAEDNGTWRLAVWPEGGELELPGPDPTVIDIDDDLKVSWSGSTPGPEDLDNGNPLRLRCQPVILADGEVWQVPQIREPDGTALPTDLTRCRKTGKLLTPIKKEYEQLWQECEYWFDLKWQAIQGHSSSFSLERALVFATQVIGLRYRFCDATQSALRVIDSVNVQTIIETAIGWQDVYQRLQELFPEHFGDDQKKSLCRSSASVNGDSGPEACDHITGQLAENSG